MALVQNSVGLMEISSGQASDISQIGLQHLRHDVRHSLPEACQKGVQVILDTKEKQQMRQNAYSQPKKMPTTLWSISGNAHRAPDG